MSVEALRPLLRLMNHADDFHELLANTVGHGEGRAWYHKLTGIYNLAGASLQGMSG